jgi:RNA polymerase sigma factor (sigma-70 family)
VSAPYARDIELARRCAAGEDEAWDRFVLEYRPILYRAADALDATGNAREIADSLFGELFGARTRSTGESLLLSYSGRSSLATWLRAVLTQRFIDRLREQRRHQHVSIEILERDEPAQRSGEPALCRLAPRDESPDPDRARDVELMQEILARVVADLHARDQLRLACYYRQGLTLAETGRVLKEHEATVSRQLARTRRQIRAQVERLLRDRTGLNDAQIARCFASVVEDAGPIDLARLLPVLERKETVANRST